jgi:hypothetical protein
MLRLGRVAPGEGVGERRAAGNRRRQVRAIDARNQTRKLIGQSLGLGQQFLRVLWRRLALLHEHALS